MANLDKVIGLALGAAFGARVLDERKAAWARIAYGAVAADLISSALSNGGPVPGLGKAPYGPQKSAAGEAAKGGASQPLNFEERRVKTIEQRVAFVHEQMVKGTRDPVVYALAREVLSRKGPHGEWAVREKDNWGEVQALFWEVRKRVRYTWDPTDYDAFQTPRKTLALKAGDIVKIGTETGQVTRFVRASCRRRARRTGTTSTSRSRCPAKAGRRSTRRWRSRPAGKCRRSLSSGSRTSLYRKLAERRR